MDVCRFVKNLKIQLVRIFITDLRLLHYVRNDDTLLILRVERREGWQVAALLISKSACHPSLLSTQRLNFVLSLRTQ